MLRDLQLVSSSSSWQLLPKQLALPRLFPGPHEWIARGANVEEPKSEEGLAVSMNVFLTTKGRGSSGNVDNGDGYSISGTPANDDGAAAARPLTAELVGLIAKMLRARCS